MSEVRRATEAEQMNMQPDARGVQGAKGQPNESGIEIDLMEYLYRLLAHWKLILCSVIIFAVIGSFYGNKEITPMYRATSTIYVVGTGTNLTFSNIQLGTYMMSDYIKVFDIWEVHEEVRKNLGLTDSYSALRGMISVKNDDGTRMLDITAVSSDPKLAAALANEYANVVSNYIADTMRMDKPSIMSVALEPTNPFNISYTRNTTRFILIGLILPAAFVFIQMLLDDKMKTAEDIQKYTGLVNLGVIPVEEDLRANKSSKKNKTTKGRKKA